MTDSDDSDLVERCLGGEKDAFDALVRRYEKTLYHLAFRMTGDPEDALDLTQAAFLKAYQNLSSYGRSSKFFSWIYRIAVNESLNHTQSARTRRTLRQGLAEVQRVETPRDDDLRPGEAADWVEPALLELTLEHRTVVILRHFLGLSYQEMADVLGISTKTVKSRLFSARRVLRGFLVEQMPGAASRG